MDDIERFALMMSKRKCGLLGILDELEDDCRKYLNGRIDSVKIDNLANQTTASKRLALAECDDEMTEGVCWLLIKTLYLKGKIEGHTDRNNFGYEVFQLAATTEKFKFQPLFKYVDTGQKVLFGYDQGIGRENQRKKEDKKKRYEAVLTEYRTMLNDGVSLRRLVSEFMLKHPGRCSERTLRRIKRKL